MGARDLGIRVVSGAWSAIGERPKTRSDVNPGRIAGRSGRDAGSGTCTREPAIASIDQRVRKPGAERFSCEVVAQLERRDAGQAARVGGEEAHARVAASHGDFPHRYVSLDERLPHPGEARGVEEARGSADSAFIHPSVHGSAGQPCLAREPADPAWQRAATEQAHRSNLQPVGKRAKT
jgi:hypothetical protein